MELKEYIKHRDITIQKAANELGITRQYLHEILSNKKMPGKKLIIKIIDWSQGIVKLENLWKI